jgi:hypothetical protein
MTRQEAIKILSVLKAAYPNSYRGMTKEEANGTVNIWAIQFGNIPYDVVSIAVNKLISVNTFPPSISEVKEKIRGLYWEALGELPYKEGGLYCNNNKELSPEKIKLLKEIIRVVEPMRTGMYEPTLGELLQGYGGYLCADTKQIEGDSKK